MKVLIVDIELNGIDYALYSLPPSPFYPFTGNPLGLSLFSKKINRGFCKEDEIIEIVNGFKKLHRIDYIVIGLPFYRFNHHIIELPLKKEKEIRTALPFELEKRLPLPIDEYIYDFSVLKRKKEGLNLLVLSIRRQHLLNMIEPLRATGIPIYGITCTFMTLISEFARKNRGRAVLVDEADDFIYLACLSGPELKTVRLIRKDEDIIYPFGFEDPSIPRYIIKSPADEIQNRELKDFRRLDIDKLFNTLKVLSKEGSLKFHPEDLISKLKDIRQSMALSFIGVSVILFLLTDIIAYYKEKNTLDYLIQKAGTEEVKVKENPDEEGMRLVSMYASSRHELIDIFNMLTRTMPRGAILTAISVDMQNKTIEIEGSAQRSSVVLEALERSGLFRDITYSGPITIKEGKENFKFRMVTR